MSTHGAALNRWRLVLGKSAEAPLPLGSGQLERMDDALAFPNITFFPPAKILNSCADLRYFRVLPRCPARSSIYFTSNLSEN